MELWLGTSIGVFLGLTVVLFGGTAFMAGQALAVTWRPVWQVYPYCLLLGFADRFLTYALFEGKLLILSGYIIDTLILTLICLLAYRITQVRKMVSQYPWLYERAGWFFWRERR